MEVIPPVIREDQTRLEMIWEGVAAENSLMQINKNSNLTELTDKLKLHPEYKGTLKFDMQFVVFSIFL